MSPGLRIPTVCSAIVAPPRLLVGRAVSVPPVDGTRGAAFVMACCASGWSGEPRNRAATCSPPHAAILVAQQEETMQVLDNRTLTALFLAILSTYRDCRDLGFASEAERILGVRRTHSHCKPKGYVAILRRASVCGE